MIDHKQPNGGTLRCVLKRSMPQTGNVLSPSASKGVRLVLNRTAVALASLCLLAGPAVPNASADSKGSQLTATVGSPLDHTHAKVAHFGYDGTNTYQSPTLDGSDARAADPANWLPPDLVARARATGPDGSSRQTRAVGFVCTLWVGKVVLTTTLEAGTEQTCTGAFSEQYTVAWFERSSWSGWRSMTESGTGPSTSNQVNDSTFRVTCNPSGGTYDCQLKATPMGRSSEDGRLVAGPILTGESGRYTCGT